MHSLLALSLAALLVHTSLAQTEKPKLRSGKQQNASAAQHVTENPPTPPPGNTQTTSPPRAEWTEGSNSKSNEKPPQNNLILWFTGAIAFFALVQSSAMLFQYCAMRRQADYMKRGLRISIRSVRVARRSANAARTAADAAFLNTQAAVNSERAWIVMELIDEGDNFKLVATNYGRTPAQFIGYNIQHSYSIAEKDLPPAPPEYSQSGPGYAESQPFVVPEEEWEITIFQVGKAERVKAGLAVAEAIRNKVGKGAIEAILKHPQYSLLVWG